jgi:L-lactate dehydrogenase complex protein LldG
LVQEINDIEHEIYHPLNCSLSDKFSDELLKVNGNCIFCQDISELKLTVAELIHNRKWSTVFCIDRELLNILENIDYRLTSDYAQFTEIEAAITPCEFLIARTGSIMVSSALSSGRRLNVFPPVHIVVAFISQLVYDLSDAYREINRRYNGGLPSMISVITGPSRTSDIEKTLILGAHGPKELIVLLINTKN